MKEPKQDTIFNTSERIEKGALLLARIQHIEKDQLISDQIKRMEYLIDKTGFELKLKE